MVFAPFTQIDKCVGKEIRARFGGEDFVGMLAGTYSTSGVPMLVLTPMTEDAREIHIPLAGAVILVNHGR